MTTWHCMTLSARVSVDWSRMRNLCASLTTASGSVTQHPTSSDLGLKSEPSSGGRHMAPPPPQPPGGWRFPTLPQVARAARPRGEGGGALRLTTGPYLKRTTGNSWRVAKAVARRVAIRADCCCPAEASVAGPNSVCSDRSSSVTNVRRSTTISSKLTCALPPSVLFVCFGPAHSRLQSCKGLQPAFHLHTVRPV